METERELLFAIKQICIVNFFELQEIKKHLNIETKVVETYDHYAESIDDRLQDLDEKTRLLIHNHDHLRYQSKD